MPARYISAGACLCWNGRLLGVGGFQAPLVSSRLLREISLRRIEANPEFPPNAHNHPQFRAGAPDRIAIRPPAVSDNAGPSKRLTLAHRVCPAHRVWNVRSRIEKHWLIAGPGQNG